jgi:hypothetical protein
MRKARISSIKRRLERCVQTTGRISCPIAPGATAFGLRAVRWLGFSLDWITLRFIQSRPSPSGETCAIAPPYRVKIDAGCAPEKVSFTQPSPRPCFLRRGAPDRRKASGSALWGQRNELRSFRGRKRKTLAANRGSRFTYRMRASNSAGSKLSACTTRQQGRRLFAAPVGQLGKGGKAPHCIPRVAPRHAETMPVSVPFGPCSIAHRLRPACAEVRQ